MASSFLAAINNSKPPVTHSQRATARGGGGGELFSINSSSNPDVDYHGESMKGNLNLSKGINEQSPLHGPIEEIARIETKKAEDLLRNFGIPDILSKTYSSRSIYCSHPLNLQSITCIGYDMDSTLIHYNVMAWGRCCYYYCMENLKDMGYPVDGLAFDPDLVIRGLVIDKERGNLVKADQFGCVNRAMHGTHMLPTQAVSMMYGKEIVELRKESQWKFLNTLFSIPEAVAYMQMVDRLDEGVMSPDLGPLNYKSLYKAVGKAILKVHGDGRLKSEIMSKPELFVEPDPELPLALLDQKEAGKTLLLITNSDYLYTDEMMQHAFDRFLPTDMEWRDLFDMVIVSARKPEFFQISHPMYEVMTEEGLMRQWRKLWRGGLYSGGSAQLIEKEFNIRGDKILYVGDHMYKDVCPSKVHSRWRTALICREFEEEYNSLIHGREQRTMLRGLINQKEVVEELFNQVRLALQRRSTGCPAQSPAAAHMEDHKLNESIQRLLVVMQRLDAKIAPLLERDGEHFNRRWGYLLRARLYDKSLLARQIEKYADLYTSRVSNFLHYTPYMNFLLQEKSLAHDSYSFYHPVPENNQSQLRYSNYRQG